MEGIKNINKFIIRVLVEAGSHGRDLFDGGDLPKYPRIKRPSDAQRRKVGCDVAFVLPQLRDRCDRAAHSTTSKVRDSVSFVTSSSCAFTNLS